MHKYTIILRNGRLQALETGVYSQELLLKRITLIFWNMWRRYLNAFKSSAWASCKIIDNISPPELLWGSVHFFIMPPSEFQSSGQFKASTFVRKEHYMSFRVPHGFHKSHCCQILGKTQELQDSPACNFMLRSFKRNEAAAEPERVNLGKDRFVCENNFTLGLFGCYQCNVKCKGKRLSMEKTQTRLQPTQRVQSPTRTASAGASQCFSWLCLWVWRGVWTSWKPHSFHSTHGPILCLPNTPVRVVSAPPKFFLCQWLRCFFGSELSNVQIAHPVLHPIAPLHTDPSPWAWLLAGTKGHSLVIPSPGSLPRQLPKPGSNSASLFLKSYWELQKSWALVASCAKAHYSGVWVFKLLLHF